MRLVAISLRCASPVLLHLLHLCLISLGRPLHWRLLRRRVDLDLVLLLLYRTNALVEYLFLLGVLQYLVVVHDGVLEVVAWIVQHALVVLLQGGLFAVLLNKLDQLLALRAESFDLAHFNLRHVDIEASFVLAGAGCCMLCSIW